MNELYTKSFEGFEKTKFDAKKGIVSAVVTSFGNYDVVNDRIMEGALDNFLKTFDGTLPMLFQHDKNEIIGERTSFSIQDDKVVGDGEIYPEVTRGANTMALISRGMIGSTSIGFRASKFDRNDEGGIDFEEINLVEVSMVKTPANPKATLLSAKNDAGEISIRNIERILRESGLSKTQSQCLISKGAKGLSNLSDSDDLAEQILRALQTFRQ